jgi:hypothetical protein
LGGGVVSVGGGAVLLGGCSKTPGQWLGCEGSELVDSVGLIQ